MVALIKAAQLLLSLSILVVLHELDTIGLLVLSRRASRNFICS